MISSFMEFTLGQEFVEYIVENNKRYFKCKVLSESIIGRPDILISKHKGDTTEEVTFELR